jgi:hypothetical protein
VSIGLAFVACASTAPDQPSTGAAGSGVGGVGGVDHMDGTGGTGGAAGMGGAAGVGGAAADDSVLCAALKSAARPELLAAGADATSATPLSGPDILHNVSIPPGGGYVSLTLSSEHTTFAVFAGDVGPLKLLYDGAVLTDESKEATCSGATFQRIEHHSHMPVTFVAAIPPTDAGKTILFYRLL